MKTNEDMQPIIEDMRSKKYCQFTTLLADGNIAALAVSCEHHK